MVNPMNAVNDNPWIAEEAEAADAAAAENANGEEAAKPGKIKIEREQIKLEKRLCREVGKAILDYNMIEEGDKVMVCMSGGKDSYTLLDILRKLQKRAPVKFDIVAVNLDQKQPGFPEHVLPEYFQSIGVDYHIENQDTYSVVKRVVPEGKTTCGLCSRLRRAILYKVADQLGCNKVALGHHLDDAVETFYMNLWREGRIGCFSPVTYLSQRDLTLIRPMLLATEYEVQCAVREAGLPIVKSRCPADGVTVREQTKEFVQERCRTDHAFRQKTLHALQESGIDGWRPVHTGRTSNPSPKEGMHHADAEL